MQGKQYPYYPYSEYLKTKYGEKVYKLPVNLPVTCPNRRNGRGCAFCAESGTGFEAMESSVPVKEQLLTAKARIAKRYHAYKYIAYFQNYTKYLPSPGKTSGNICWKQQRQKILWNCRIHQT